MFVEDETGRRLTTRLGPWGISTPAGVIHGYENSLEQSISGNDRTRQAETMGYADQKLYERRDNHLKESA